MVHIRPDVPGKTWIRARDCYPKNGQRVLYWLEDIGGPFIGEYSEEPYEQNGKTYIYHIFSSSKGYLTNDDVYYIPLEPNEPIPIWRKNRDKIDPVDWEFMEDE